MELEEDCLDIGEKRRNSMINWGRLQIHKIPMPASEKNPIIIGAVLTIAVVLVLSWFLYQIEPGKDTKRYIAILVSCVVLDCVFTFSNEVVGNPYYKVTVKVEKPVNFEEQLLDIEKDKENIKLTDGYVTMPEEKGDVFKPYLDCMLAGETIKVSSFIQKKRFGRF